MGAFEDKLINDAVYSNRAAYELGFCVLRILKDKVVTIKSRQIFPSDTSSKLVIVNLGQDTKDGGRGTEWVKTLAHCRDVVHVGLLDHCGHSVFHRAIFKFVVCVLVPYCLQVEVRAMHESFQERKISGMRNRLRGVGETGLKWRGECIRAHPWVVVEG